MKYQIIAASLGGALTVLLIWGAYAENQDREYDRQQLCRLSEGSAIDAVRDVGREQRDVLRRTLIMALSSGHCLPEEERALWAQRMQLKMLPGSLLDALFDASKHCNAGAPDETKEAAALRLLGELQEVLR